MGYLIDTEMKLLSLEDRRESVVVIERIGDGAPNHVFPSQYRPHPQNVCTKIADRLDEIASTKFLAGSEEADTWREAARKVRSMDMSGPSPSGSFEMSKAALMELLAFFDNPDNRVKCHLEVPEALPAGS